MSAIEGDKLAVAEASFPTFISVDRVALSSGLTCETTLISAVSTISCVSLELTPTEIVVCGASCVGSGEGAFVAKSAPFGALIQLVENS